MDIFPAAHRRVVWKLVIGCRLPRPLYRCSRGHRGKTEEFFRLFLVPGVHHGGGGPGLTEFDSFSALEAWVEKGQAPDKLIAGRLINGVVERTRPVYPYPVIARYSGIGDPKLAESFVPFEPTPH